ncbi:MAG: phosphate acyltransferase PlsX [bacterium]|jgi:glycerol-3-phosphate acyltransferase PlsX
MRIAVDAMGGDHAPETVVKGALEAALKTPAEIILVGDIEQIKLYLPKQVPANIKLQHASQVVAMDDSPVRTVIKKSDSSLVVAAQMVKDGNADALITAGNTGAAVAICKLSWEMLPGVERPAIATILPKLAGHVVMLDSGATTDCEPEWLLQFGVMGKAFSERVLGVKDAKVALLSIGEERGKGNLLVKKAYDLLSAKLPGFIGNIEGKSFFTDGADVVVCDGFVGNALLKFGEGMIEFFVKLLKEVFPSSKLLLIPLFPLIFFYKNIQRLKKRLDYEEYGGAPLLGVNGVCIIAHGRSGPKAIRSAILEGAKAVEGGLIEAMAASCKAASLEEPSHV